MSGRARAAVVVIHGIGQQPPLATLARVAQGLMTDARSRGARLRASARAVPGSEGIEPCLRLEGSAGEGLAGFASVDVYEFAWQRLVAGRASPLAVLQWLLQTGLAPLHVRRSWRLLAIAGAPSARVVFRHVWIASAVLLLWLTLLLALALSGLQLTTLLPALVPALVGAAGRWSELAALGVAATLIAAAVALSMAVAMVADAVEELGLRRAQLPDGWAGGYAGARRAWLPAALWGVALTSALALSAGWAARGAWRELGLALAPLAATPALVTGLAAAVALLVSWGAVRSYVGDIALYVKGPADSPFARTRARLQAALVARLRTLVAADRYEPYDAVLLVGHSLGSVLALDALDILAAEARAERADSGGVAALQRLRGLFTFGSPLDKVAYFFRERIGDEEAVRAELAAFWRGTRRQREPRDPGPYALEPTAPSYPWLRWWHLHAPRDPISDALWLYRVDARHVLAGGSWWGAHARYWRDPRTYALLRQLLAELAASQGDAAG
jgi:hypothetical protein